MAEIDLSEIGARGLVVAEGNQVFKFVREHEWLALGPVSNETPAMAQLKQLNVIVAKVDQGMYVDLELLAGLGPPANGVAPGNAHPLAAGRSVFLRHQGQVFQVPQSELDKPEHKIDPGFEGAAGVVITRGSVVAAVPPNPIPAGTYCVVINMAGI